MNCVSGQDVVDRIDCIHFKFNMEHQVKGRWGLAIVQPTNPVVSFSSDVIYACLLSTQSPHLLLYFVIFLMNFYFLIALPLACFLSQENPFFLPST